MQDFTRSTSVQRENHKILYRPHPMIIRSSLHNPIATAFPDAISLQRFLRSVSRRSSFPWSSDVPFQNPASPTFRGQRCNRLSAVLTSYLREWRPRIIIQSCPDSLWLGPFLRLMKGNDRTNRHGLGSCEGMRLVSSVLQRYALRYMDWMYMQAVQQFEANSSTKILMNCRWTD